jgi:hypothetical protein
MEWRLERNHLCDALLFHVIEAEAMLVEARTPGLLSRPTESTIHEATLLLDRVQVLKVCVCVDCFKVVLCSLTTVYTFCNSSSSFSDWRVEEV